MALTKPQRRLFIGGPRNGEWHECTSNFMMVPHLVEADVMQYLAPKPEDRYKVPIPERTEYIADVVDLFGYRLHVMVTYRELDVAGISRSEALLKAILQRDVLAALNPKL